MLREISQTDPERQTLGVFSHMQNLNINVVGWPCREGKGGAAGDWRQHIRVLASVKRSLQLS